MEVLLCFLCFWRALTLNFKTWLPLDHTSDQGVKKDKRVHGFKQNRSFEFSCFIKKCILHEIDLSQIAHVYTTQCH